MREKSFRQNGQRDDRKREDNNTNVTLKRKNLRDMSGMKMTGTTKTTILKTGAKKQELRTFQETAW